MFNWTPSKSLQFADSHRACSFKVLINYVKLAQTSGSRKAISFNTWKVTIRDIKTEGKGKVKTTHVLNLFLDISF